MQMIRTSARGAGKACGASSLCLIKFLHSILMFSQASQLERQSLILQLNLSNEYLPEQFDFCDDCVAYCKHEYSIVRLGEMLVTCEDCGNVM